LIATVPPLDTLALNVGQNSDGFANANGAARIPRLTSPARDALRRLMNGGIPENFSVAMPLPKNSVFVLALLYLMDEINSS
jgi:hypothetical protein